VRAVRKAGNAANGHLPLPPISAVSPMKAPKEGTTPVTVPCTVECVATTTLPTRFGLFRIAAYRADDSTAEHLALMCGDLTGQKPVLARLHSECLTGDIFGSSRCDCGDQLAAGMRSIASAGCGVLLYLRQEGRGIGLVNKLRAYALQEQGLDTVDANTALGLPADRREYGSAAAILRHLGISRVRLITNNPAKVRALEEHGVRVVERIGVEIPPNPTNRAYLQTKAIRMGHLLSLVEEPIPFSSDSQPVTHSVDREPGDLSSMG
jgi:GTP cyclohydrolase II